MSFVVMWGGESVFLISSSSVLHSFTIVFYHPSIDVLSRSINSGESVRCRSPPYPQVAKKANKHSLRFPENPTPSAPAKTLVTRPKNPQPGTFLFQKQSCSKQRLETVSPHNLKHNGVSSLPSLGPRLHLTLLARLV